VLFNSYTFILFLACVLWLHNLPLPWRVKKFNLLWASYLFYAAWNPPFVALLWISTLVDWHVGKRLHRADSRVARKALLLASLGVNLRRGNSKVSEYNMKLGFKRRTVKTRLGIDYIGNYNNTDDVDVANNHRATAGWDIFLTDRMYVQAVFGEYFRDPFQNIAERYTLGAGIGYTLVETKKITWEIVGGPAFQKTEFASVEPGADDSSSTPVLIGGTVYDHELTGWMDFLFEYRFQVVNEDSGRYNHHMVTTFETEITSLLDFDVSFVWDRIEKPQPTEDGTIPLQDDVRLIVGLGLDW